MSRSKVKVTREKERAVHSHHSPASTEWNPPADGTIPSLPGVISAACVRSLFGKTSLALVRNKFVINDQTTS